MKIWQELFFVTVISKASSLAKISSGLYQRVESRNGEWKAKVSEAIPFEVGRHQGKSLQEYRKVVFSSQLNSGLWPSILNCLPPSIS